MKSKLQLLFLLLSTMLCDSQAQSQTLVFDENAVLDINMIYNKKDFIKRTDENIFSSQIIYFQDLDTLKPLQVKIRKRGNFRLKTCYYPPLKLKISKKNATNTIFENNRKLKLVTPCLTNGNNNDLVIKEFIAYKIYEKLSPLHFKTRLVDLTINEQRRKKIKSKTLKAFLIEDIDDLAARLNANVQTRAVHPLGQHPKVSIINAFFQCMIGNTDFSTGYQHNQKLVFKDGYNYPIPYDFDMSGLVNPPYAVISVLEGDELPITSVTDRLYRGFQRDREELLRVRKYFLASKADILALIDDHRVYFESETEFKNCKNYIASFFKIIANDNHFEKMIFDNLRIKLNLEETHNSVKNK